MSEMRMRCFVIMPFSKSSDKHTTDYWTNHFNKFLKPLIEEVPHIEASRVESLHGDILKQIITNLIVSPVVVADLTDFNPNVFWELGVRQSFKHNTITIAEEGIKLPFDVSSKATLFYSPNDHLKMEEFRNKFKAALIDCKDNPDKADSHILETISGRGTIFEIVRLDQAKNRVEGLLSECKRNQIYWERTLQELKDDTMFPGGQFPTVALQLLVTDRYLDESERFYNITENYYDYLNGFNARITRMNNLKQKEDFIKEYGLDKEGLFFNQMFELMIKQVEEVYKKLCERVSMFSSLV